MRVAVNKKGQVWVETVIYTLIGLTIIGLVLAAALPKINESKDKSIIEQSIGALVNIDNKVTEVINKGIGNRRSVQVDVKRGALIIDMDNDWIIWELDSSFKYSEEGIPVPVGKVEVLTVNEGGRWKVKLKVKYDIELSYEDKITGEHRLEVSPTPYTVTIENFDKSGDGSTLIKFVAK